MASITRQRKEVKPIIVSFTSATSGLAIDISSSTIYFTVKTVKDSSTTDSTAVISKTQYVSSGTSGQVTISLSESDTDINPQTYLFDIWRETTSGQTQVLEGKFFLEQPVTGRL